MKIQVKCTKKVGRQYNLLLECPFGIQSNAIPDFVYFGKMITSRPVRDHGECIQRCLQTSHCSAVNFFESVDAKASAYIFCLLLLLVASCSDFAFISIKCR